VSLWRRLNAALSGTGIPTDSNSLAAALLKFLLANTLAAVILSSLP
jgi:hypothetical protein